MRRSLALILLIACAGICASAQSQAPAQNNQPAKPSDRGNSTQSAPPPTDSNAVIQWLQQGGYDTLSKEGGKSTKPAWKPSVFGKNCREVDDGKGGKKTECDPPTGSPGAPGAPGTPPKYSPCSHAGSCAPGVGSDSGVVDQQDFKQLEKLLQSDTDFKKIVIDPKAATEASQAAGRGRGRGSS